MKKFFTVILILIIVFFVLNAGPVWLQRLIGFNGYSDKIYFPQWINNEEYCYLRVESFFDYGLGFSGISKDFFHPLKFFRGSNATFSIYKVNINQPDEGKLIRKITKKVDFSIPEEEKKIYDRRRFTFRQLDNGELVLLIRGRLKYLAYYIDTDGKILKKQTFDYKPLYEESIIDISPDNKKLLVTKISKLYIKNITTKQKELLVVDSKNRWPGFNKFITDNKLISYETDITKKNTNVFITNIEENSIELITSQKFSNYDKEIAILLLDADISSRDNFLFLSKIGIFKKQAGEWQMIKSLKDTNFNLFYPDISPDGKRIIGVKPYSYDYNMQLLKAGQRELDFKNNEQIVVLELRDLLK